MSANSLIQFLALLFFCIIPLQHTLYLLVSWIALHSENIACTTNLFFNGFLHFTVSFIMFSVISTVIQESMQICVAWTLHRVSSFFNTILKFSEAFYMHAMPVNFHFNRMSFFKIQIGLTHIIYWPQMGHWYLCSSSVWLLTLLCILTAACNLSGLCFQVGSHIPAQGKLLATCR